MTRISKMSLKLISCILSLVSLSSVCSEFRFATHYADHMVLQRAPYRAVIWGFGETNASVATKLQNKSYKATVAKDWRGLSVWKVVFDALPAGGPYEIVVESTVSGKEVQISLKDVLFGDVWVCGGQSNMQFTLNMAFKYRAGLQRASTYTNIRLFTVLRYSTNKAQPEFGKSKILQQWSVASGGPYLMNTKDCWSKCGNKAGSCPGFCGKNGYCCKVGWGGCPKNVEAVANPNYHSCVKDVKEHSVDEGYWNYFSALCWMYGRRLYDLYKVPVGLLSTNYGGTRVEAWSSPATISECTVKEYVPSAIPDGDIFTTSEINQDRNTATGLWNAMLSPFLSTTIYGVIWYQGEENAKHPGTYNCTFPAMIKGWRREWYQGTQGNTNPSFPFGFVQLSSVTDKWPGFPSIRWKQTAEYGYVPNPKQQDTFMAVTMDLRDTVSPYGSIHPRDKSTVAERLLLGARAVAYKEKDVYWSGPIVDHIEVTGPPAHYKTVIVYYKKSSLRGDGIQVRYNLGFEVLLSKAVNTWIPVEITSSDETSLSLRLTDQQSANNLVAVRYGWQQDPCLYKLCAVYADGEDLPSPPFIVYGPFKTCEQPAQVVIVT